MSKGISHKNRVKARFPNAKCVIVKSGYYAGTYVNLNDRRKDPFVQGPNAPTAWRFAANKLGLRK